MQARERKKDHMHSKLTFQTEGIRTERDFLRLDVQIHWIVFEGSRHRALYSLQSGSP